MSTAEPVTAAVKPATLKKRAEFLRLRGGPRWATPGFVLEAKPRPSENDAEAAPRFGFTVTKQIGKAVDRNRIRRRLRALVRATAAAHAVPRYDYVLIARGAALTRPFADLKKELEQAFRRVHHPAGRKRGAQNT